MLREPLGAPAAPPGALLMSETQPNVVPGPPLRTRLAVYLVRLAIAFTLAFVLCAAGGVIWALTRNDPVLRSIHISMYIGAGVAILAGAMLVYGAGSEDPGYGVAGYADFAWTPGEILSMNAAVGVPAYLWFFPTGALLVALGYGLGQL
jgi:hypothetical protein